KRRQIGRAVAIEATAPLFLPESIKHRSSCPGCRLMSQADVASCYRRNQRVRTQEPRYVLATARSLSPSLDRIRPADSSSAGEQSHAHLTVTSPVISYSC